MLYFIRSQCSDRHTEREQYSQVIKRTRTVNAEKEKNETKSEQMIKKATVFVKCKRGNKNSLTV